MAGGWRAGLFSMVRVSNGDSAAVGPVDARLLDPLDSASESGGEGIDLPYDDLDDEIDAVVQAPDGELHPGKPLFPNSHRSEVRVAHALFEKMTREVVKERTSAAVIATRNTRAAGESRPAHDLPLHYEPQPLASALEQMEALLAAAEPLDRPPTAGLDRVRTRRQVALARRWRRIVAEMRMAHSAALWASTTLELAVRLDVTRQLLQLLSKATLALVDGDTEYGTTQPVDSPQVGSLISAESGIFSQDGANNSAPQRAAKRIVDESYPSSGRSSSRQSRYTTLEGEPLVSDSSLNHALAWENPTQGRLAIVRDALKARYGSALTAPAASMMAGAPVVIVVRQKRFFNPLSSKQSSQPSLEDETYAFQLWQAACMGMCLVKLVEVSHPDQLGRDLSSTLKNDVLDASLSPILLVLRASVDSSLLASVKILRGVCEAFNARLHVEGPNLTLLCQPTPPDFAQQCRQYAHSLLIEPGAWFGLPSSAVVTCVHGRSIHAREAAEDDISHSVGSVETGLPPLMSMWICFVRTGIMPMRILVEEATSRATHLLENLSFVPNIQALEVGAGGNVIMSHAMSRVDRVMRKYKARERISQVNAAFLEYLAEEAAPLKIELHEWEGQAWMLFSPTRLLQGGRFYVPPLEVVRAFTTRLAQVAKLHEVALSGVAAFHNVVARCPDLQLIGETENVISSSLGFGVLRAVPAEYRKEWSHSIALRQQIVTLNSQLVSLVTMRQRAELRKGNNSLDFRCYVDSSVGPSVCIDPTITTAAIDAPKVASQAAETIVELVEELMNGWRTTELPPLEEILRRGPDTDEEKFIMPANNIKPDKYRYRRPPAHDSNSAQLPANHFPLPTSQIGSGNVLYADEKEHGENTERDLHPNEDAGNSFPEEVSLDDEEEASFDDNFENEEVESGEETGSESEKDVVERTEQSRQARPNLWSRLVRGAEEEQAQHVSGVLRVSDHLEVDDESEDGGYDTEESVEESEEDEEENEEDTEDSEEDGEGSEEDDEDTIGIEEDGNAGENFESVSTRTHEVDSGAEAGPSWFSRFRQFKHSDATPERVSQNSDSDEEESHTSESEQSVDPGTRRRRWVCGSTAPGDGEIAGVSTDEREGSESSTDQDASEEGEPIPSRSTHGPSFGWFGAPSTGQGRNVAPASGQSSNESEADHDTQASGSDENGEDAADSQSSSDNSADSRARDLSIGFAGWFQRRKLTSGPLEGTDDEADEELEESEEGSGDQGDSIEDEGEERGLRGWFGFGGVDAASDQEVESAASSEAESAESSEDDDGITQA